MTNSTKSPRVSYAITTSTRDTPGDYCNFPVPFAFETTNDIGVMIEGGRVITNFSAIFANASPTSGSVNILKSEIENATTIYIYRDMPFERETEFQADSDFRAAVINGEFDRMIWLIQQMGMQVGDALHKPLYDAGPNLELPDRQTRKNKILAFDNEGAPIALVDSPQSAINAEISATASATSAVNSALNASASDISRSLAEAAVEKIGWSDVVFVSTQDSPFTISNACAGKMYSFDCSAGDIIVNLDPIATLALDDVWAVGIIKRDASGHQITINANGTDSFGVETSLTIGTRNSGVTLVPDSDLDPNVWTPMRFGAVSGNMSIDHFTPGNDYIADVDNRITLSIAPGDISNLLVTFDGVSQHRGNMTLLGNLLTFNAPIPSGVREIEVWIGTTISIGVPADGTVTAAKLDPSLTFNGPGEAVCDNGTGTTLILDGAGDAVLRHEMTGDTSITTMNVADIGKVYSFVVRLTQNNTGGHAITLPAGTLWAYGEVPVFPTAANDICKFALETWDNGTTWEASWIGARYA